MKTRITAAILWLCACTACGPQKGESTDLDTGEENRLEPLDLVAVRVENTLEQAISCQADFEDGITLTPSLISVRPGQSEELSIDDESYARQVEHPDTFYLREGLRVGVSCLTLGNDWVDGDSFNTRGAGHVCVVEQEDDEHDAVMHCL